MNGRTVLGVLALGIGIHAGCGGDVQSQDSSAAGAGGATSSGSGSSVTTGGSTSTSAGSMSSTGSTTSTGAGGAPACDGLLEAACLAAYPTCAPIYDDACCPSCTPGPCADCSNIEFHACTASAAACAAPPSCGVTPSWACTGAPHVCPMISGPDDTYECEATAGCVVATCSPDVNCNETRCAPVTGESCTAFCESLPPSCPPDEVAEADGSCWTGFCIPSAVCGF